MECFCVTNLEEETHKIFVADNDASTHRVHTYADTHIQPHVQARTHTYNDVNIRRHKTYARRLSSRILDWLRRQLQQPQHMRSVCLIMQRRWLKNRVHIRLLALRNRPRR
jgi:hypothetical protein